jgi:hypothetical protein
MIKRFVGDAWLRNPMPMCVRPSCDDRAWSDSDDEVGDDAYEEGYLMQDWGAKYQMAKTERALLPKDHAQPRRERPGIVPALPIKDRLPVPATEAELHATGQGA